MIIRRPLRSLTPGPSRRERLEALIYCRAPRAMNVFTCTLSQRTPLSMNTGMRSSKLLSILIILKPPSYTPCVQRAPA